MPSPDPASDLPQFERTLPQSDEQTPTWVDSAPPAAPTLRLPDLGDMAPADLPDRFAIARVLGRGAYGTVYEAFDRQRQMPVALKVLLRVDAGALEQFKQEFYTLADLKHPNIITLFELFVAQPPWFFTMEMLAGAAQFDAYLRAHPEQLRSAVGQLAVGVSVLHAAGKLHRDLKSSNVLVTPAGRVVVSDFGLAADAGHEGRGGPSGLVGSVPYMSPEQGAEHPVTPASDWYSVGVMFYEVLTARRPFEPVTGDVYDYLKLKAERDPPAPSAVCIGVPADLNDLCMALLRREPLARPGSVEICRRLGVPPPPRPPFVGRTAHLAALFDAFAAARSGSTVVLYVHGPSGSGKSALLDQFLGGMDESGDALVLSGRCYEHAAVPFKALDGLADALGLYLRELPQAHLLALLPPDLPLLARVFPVLQTVQALVAPTPEETGPLDPRELRRRAFAALRDLLARLGKRMNRPPLVVAVDDLHWGDTESAEQLVELLRSPEPPPLLFIACYRSEDEATSPCLRTLLAGWAHGGPDVRRLEVGPLAVGEARQLVTRLLGPDAGDRVATVVGEAAGNPLYLAELARLSAPGSARGIGLDDMIARRIGALNDPARRLLEAMAFAGRPVATAVAVRAAELRAEDQIALWTLRAARLVRGTGATEREEIEIYHDRIRQAVMSLTDLGNGRRYQRGLAEALEATELTADPEWVALLWDGAGERVRSARHFLRAAHQAVDAFAFDCAAGLFRAGLERLPADAAERSAEQVALAEALAAAGRGAEAAREYLAVAERATPAEALSLRQNAAVQLLLAGHFDEALQLLRDVLAAVGQSYPKSPWRALASLLVRRAVLRCRGFRFHERPASEIPAAELARLDACGAVALGLSMIDPIRGSDFQTRYLLLALRTGEPARIARALAYEAGYAAALGVPAKAKIDRLLAQANALAQNVGDPYEQGVVQICRGVVGYLCCAWRESIDGCAQAAAILRDRCAGVGRERDTLTAFWLYSLYFRGDLAELARRLPAVVRDAEERGDRFALSSLGTFAQPMAALCADDPDSVRAGMDAAIRPWTRQAFQIPHYNHLVTGAQVELYAGRPDVAWSRIAERESLLRSSQLLRVQIMRVIFVRLRAETALALAGRSDRGKWLRSARADVRRLEREQSPMAAAFALILRGRLAELEGEQDKARQFLEAAVVQCEAADMHLYAAATRRRLGVLLGGDEGRSLVTLADEWMGAQGIRNPDRMTAMLVP